MDAPAWLANEPIIQQLLMEFLSRLDNKSYDTEAPLRSIRLTESRFPGLFQPQGQDDPDITWKCLQELQQKGVLRIQPAPTKSYQATYLNAGVALEPAFFEVIRSWFGRPHPQTIKQVWQKQVAAYSRAFPGATNALTKRPIHVEGLSPEQLLSGFAAIGQWLNKGLYQSQISARCFAGRAKLLDGREELLEELFPDYLHRIRPRPVLLQVCLCENPLGILFIENEDCFLHAIEDYYPHTQRLILVYGSGFRGSAQRIRSPDGVRFFYKRKAQSYSAECFEQDWLAAKDEHLDWYFWGDLDFSGMAILSALRKQFSRMTSWKPGYRALLSQLPQGHLLHETDKKNQLLPTQTGCDYADQILLPALRAHGRGLDQEWWDGQDCTSDADG